jgi:hypothetical protein
LSRIEWLYRGVIRERKGKDMDEMENGKMDAVGRKGGMEAVPWRVSPAFCGSPDGRSVPTWG